VEVPVHSSANGEEKERPGVLHLWHVS